MQRRTRFILLFLIFALFFAACARAPEVPLEEQALLPEDTSGRGQLTLWYWDGAIYRAKHMFQPERGIVLEALESATGTQAETFPAEGFPIWGLSFNYQDHAYEVAWRDGVWSDSDGKLLDADLDFQAIWDLVEVPTLEREQDHYPSGANQRRLALQDGNWVSAYLVSAPEPQPLPGLDLTLDIGEDGQLMLVLANNASEELTLGSEYAIHAQVDGIWYRIPHKDTRFYTWTQELLFLPPGDVYESNVWLDSYAPLPDGTYRVLKSYDKDHSSAAEFRMESGVPQLPAD